MKFFKLHPRLLIGILIAIFFGVALCFRVLFPYDQVFGHEWIKFTSVDAYYYMRLVDNLVHNFPHLISFDPYFIYPGGSWVGSIHFSDWFLAFIIWVVGLGSPTQHTVNVVGVYYPAILGALTVIPVYFIGKALVNRWAGVLAAALIAVLPGEFLGRTILGFTDTPAAETLLTTVTMAFLILAIKTSQERQLTLSHLKQRDWSIITRPLVYSLFAGIFLGSYLITWQGALLFVFIISLYLIIQSIIDHLRRKSVDYLGIVGVILFLVTLIIFLPFSPHLIFSVSLVFALFIPIVLIIISRVMKKRKKKLKPVYYPLALVGIAIVGMAIFYAINPVLLKQMVALFSIFAPIGATATTTLEMQPFLSPQGQFTTAIAWGNFTTCFYLSLLAFIYLLFYRAFYRRQSRTEENLFLVWGVVIFILTLVQRRFAYYFVVNVALLTAYLGWQAIWYAGLRKLSARPAEVSESPDQQSARDKRKKEPAASGFPIYHFNAILATIIVLLFAYLPNVVKSIEVAKEALYAPSDAWQNSLTWLKDNTPDPFGDTDFYYKLYEPVPRGESYHYPASAYGVTSWWDYGYWITRIAHRLPSANPGQNAAPIRDVAQLFLSQEEADTHEIMERLKSSYIIIDYMTATSKFWAVVTWAEREQSEFYEVYALPYEGQLIGVQLFYPAYYHSLLVRLYNFDGKAVTDMSPMVVSYEEKVTSDGKRYKQITDVNEFTSYEEALDYIKGQKSGKHKIVSQSRFKSPVPLEAVENYQMIHSSENTVTLQDTDSAVPAVKIFKYTK